MEHLEAQCWSGNADACHILAQSDLFQIAFILACAGAAVWACTYFVEWLANSRAKRR